MNSSQFISKMAILINEKIDLTTKTMSEDTEPDIKPRFFDSKEEYEIEFNLLRIQMLTRENDILQLRIEKKKIEQQLQKQRDLVSEQNRVIKTFHDSQSLSDSQVEEAKKLLRKSKEILYDDKLTADNKVPELKNLFFGIFRTWKLFD